MSKRAKEKAERIANGIMISVQGKTGRVVYNTKEKSFTHYELMCAAQKGYEQAEKDTIERAVTWLKDNANKYIVDLTETYPDAPVNIIVGGMCWEDLTKYLKDNEQHFKPDV